MKVCVVGLGYIGLPTAAMLASRGHDVVGYDVNAKVVELINSGHAHFQEPDLQMLLTAAVGTGKLRASVQPESADYYIIAVPTPVRAGGAPDMGYVNSAAEAIAPMLRSGSTVILESTSPVGSTENLTAALAAARPDLTFPSYKDDATPAQIAVSHCPERILPGQMVRELVSNDRIIGGMTATCSQKALKLYKTFVMGACYITDARAAELSKLTENAFRDVNIAFANELSMVCDQLGVDVWQVREMANKHPRVSILEPGAGVGGHCIAVDPWFIVNSAPEESRLIRTARLVNDEKPTRVLNEVTRAAAKLQVPVIACYGLTYKADVDDIRESPALEIVNGVAAINGATVLVCEPNLDQLPKSLQGYSNVSLTTAEEATARADIVCFLVGHAAFRGLNSEILLEKIVIDPIGLVSRGSLVKAD